MTSQPEIHPKPPYLKIVSGESEADIHLELDSLTDEALIASFKEHCATVAQPAYYFDEAPRITSQPIVAAAAHDFVYTAATNKIMDHNLTKLIPHETVERRLQEYYREFPHPAAANEIQRRFNTNRNLYKIVALRRKHLSPEIRFTQQMVLAARGQNEILIERSATDLLAAYGMTLQHLHQTLGQGVNNSIKLS